MCIFQKYLNKIMWESKSWVNFLRQYSLHKLKQKYINIQNKEESLDTYRIKETFYFVIEIFLITNIRFVNFESLSYCIAMNMRMY